MLLKVVPDGVQASPPPELELAAIELLERTELLDKLLLELAATELLERTELLDKRLLELMATELLEPLLNKSEDELIGVFGSESGPEPFPCEEQPIAIKSKDRSNDV